MMAKAGKYHAVRAAVVALVLALIGLGSWEGNGRLQAKTTAGSAARIDDGRSARDRDGDGPVSALG